MSESNAKLFIQWLKIEGAPALGGTAPVAIAFAAANACRYLYEPCISLTGFISESLHKSMVGLTMPGAHYSGIAMAAAVGIYGGDPDKGMETLKSLKPSQVKQAHEMVNRGAISLTSKDTPDFIHIDMTATSANNRCRIVIKHTHTCITELYINEQPVIIKSVSDPNSRALSMKNFNIGSL